MSDYAYLDENFKVVDTTDYMEAHKKTGDRKRVGRDEAGDYIISTVFLCLNHAFSMSEDLYFETMAFPKTKNGKISDYSERFCDRCSTYEQALKMHERGKQWAIDELDVRKD